MVKTFSQCGFPGAPPILGCIGFLREGNLAWKELRIHQSIATEKVERYLFMNLCTRSFQFSENLWRVPGKPKFQWSIRLKYDDITAFLRGSKVLICWRNLHILQGFKGADTYSRKPSFFIKILYYDIKKEKRQSQFCSASKSEAPLTAVIFTVAAYPNEGEGDSGKDARSTEKPI